MRGNKETFEKALSKLLEELSLDSETIKLLKNLSDTSPLTVRELSSRTRISNSKIYRSLQLLEAFKLVEKYDERPAKFTRVIDEQKLQRLALKVEQEIISETKSRLENIKFFLPSSADSNYDQKDLSFPNDGSLPLEIFGLEPWFDIEGIFQPINLERVIELIKMALQEERFQAIYPFERLNLNTSKIFDRGIEKLLKIEDLENNLKVIRLLLVTPRKISEPSEILPMLGFVTKVLLFIAEETEVRYLNEALYPTISSDNFVLVPILSPNYESIFSLILLRAKSIVNKVNSQFHNFWMNASHVGRITKEDVVEWLE